MVRLILTIPNPVLTKPSIETSPDSQSRRDLIHTLGSLQNAIGLAAPQIGIPKRMIAIKDPLTNKITVYRNPRITSASITVDKDVEGCLSIPSQYFLIQRSTKIEIDHAKGKESFQGDLARVVQHEIDHLNGILISDIGERIMPQPIFNP